MTIANPIYDIEREFEILRNTIEQKDEELRQKKQLIEALKRQLAEQNRKSDDPI